MEVGCLMDFKHAKYIKGGLFTWQVGFGVLFVDGKKVTPSIVPMNMDGSFVFESRVWKP
jgi:hypothetical protein